MQIDAVGDPQLLAPAPIPSDALSATTDAHQASRAQRIGYLDGIRAVAITMVLLVHWISSQVPFAYGGYIGVDVFFVLSGYIITRLLWPRVGPNLNIHDEWRSFLKRRVRRLYPALIGLCVGVVLISLVLPATPLSPRDMLLAAGLTLSQLVSPLHAGTKLEFGPLGVAWSLSIEWMFYLPWPLVLGLLRRRLEQPRRIAAVLGVTAALVYVASTAQSPEWFYYGPVARIPEIIVGAAVALWLIDEPGPRPRAAWLHAVLPWAALACLFAYTFFGPKQYSVGYRFVGMPLAVCAAIILIVAGAHSTSRPALKLLSARPVTLLGRSSYSIYLWHQVPLAFITRQTFPNMSLLIVAAIGGLSAVALASTSYLFLERPFLKARPRALRA